jgi:hypothetical protein
VSDEVSGYPGAPPGWYADPAGGLGQRWWDGYAWTETTVLPATVPPPPPPPPHPTSSYGAAYPTPPPPYVAGQPWAPTAADARTLVAEELRISPLARLAIAFPAVTSFLDVIAWVSNASQWRSFGHQFHVAMVAEQNHQTAPQLTVPSSWGGLTTLLGFIGIAAIIVECIWQYRAARAARALHWPAKRSPGWGVAFWFIPVVNLWMPYQALRDCLAPTDPNRAIVLRFWLLTLGMGIGGALTIIGLMTSTPVGEVFGVISAVCALGVLATAPRVVAAIASAHRTAATP